VRIVEVNRQILERLPSVGCFIIEYTANFEKVSGSFTFNDIFADF
jgi:hypothetical protein